jgi:hypothetical protein
MPFLKPRHIARVVAIAAVGAVLAGCGLFGDDKDQQTTPVGYPRSWIWNAASGISLQSAEAKTVRGWVESQTLYQDSRVSYPGFTEATSPELLSDWTAANDSDQSGGTNRYLIRSITTAGDELHANLCEDGWDEFSFKADGTLFGAGFDITLRQLVMRKKTADDPSPSHSAPQQALIAATPTPIGRLPYQDWLKGPTENVFNDWVAVGWTVNTDPPADCLAWFKRNHPGLHSPPDYTDDARPNRPTAPPPPTLPASPGW